MNIGHSTGSGCIPHESKNSEKQSSSAVTERLTRYIGLHEGKDPRATSGILSP